MALHRVRLGGQLPAACTAYAHALANAIHACCPRLIIALAGAGFDHINLIIPVSPPRPPQSGHCHFSDSFVAYINRFRCSTVGECGVPPVYPEERSLGLPIISTRLHVIVPVVSRRPRPHPRESCPALLARKLCSCQRARRDLAPGELAYLGEISCLAPATPSVFRRAVLCTARCRSAARPITPRFRPAARLEDVAVGLVHSVALKFREVNRSHCCQIALSSIIITGQFVTFSPFDLCVTTCRRSHRHDTNAAHTRATSPVPCAVRPFHLTCSSLYSTSALSAFSYRSELLNSRHTLPAPCCRGSCCSLLAPSNHCT